jgi:hypothetical protein
LFAVELGIDHSLTRNQSYAALKAGKYPSIRIFHFDHNPQPSPQYIVDPSLVTTPWQTAQQASAKGCNTPQGCDLGHFSAACYYFAESLTDRMANEKNGEVVPMGLIMSAYGGTMIGEIVCIMMMLSTTSADDFPCVMCSRIMGACGGAACVMLQYHLLRKANGAFQLINCQGMPQHRSR